MTSRAGEKKNVYRTGLLKTDREGYQGVRAQRRVQEGKQQAVKLLVVGDVEGKRREDRPDDKEETAAPARNGGCEVVNTGERTVLQKCRCNKGPWRGVVVVVVVVVGGGRGDR